MAKKKEMSNYKVSVVLAVFNAEKYISECIESIINQSLTNIEIICIDDKSLDNSVKILKQYAKHDERLKVIENPENIGAGASRNIGIANANGEYISLVDADDVLAIDMLEIVYNKCIKENAEVGIYDYATFEDEWTNHIIHTMKPYYKKQIGNAVFNGDDIRNHIFQIINWAAWSKLYKLSFLRESQVKFSSLRNAEDTPFTAILLAKAKRMIYINVGKPLYFYRINNPQQLTMKLSYEPLTILQSMLLLKEMLESNNCLEKYEVSYYSSVVLQTSYMLNVTRPNEKEVIFRIFKDKWLKKLDLFDKTENQFMSEYIYKRYKCLLLSSYAAYKESVGYALFRENRHLKHVFDYLKEKDKKIALWGIGEKGRDVLAMAKRYDFKFKSLIDSNALTCTEIENYTIKNYESVEEKIDIIVITNPNYIKEILETLKGRSEEIELLDLYAYVTLNIELEYCFISSFTDAVT